MSQYSEEELRKQIREELAAEAARAKERRQIASTPPRDEAETMRRRILEEERRRFFQDSAEHFEYINENGDVEWLTREEITAREGYFDYEEHVEDPLAGRRRFLIWMSVGVFVMLSAAWGVVRLGSASDGSTQRCLQCPCSHYFSGWPGKRLYDRCHSGVAHRRAPGGSTRLGISCQR